MFSFLIALAAAVAHPNCKDPQTEIDMNTCATRPFNAADARMTRQYRLLAARMKQMDAEEPGYLAALLESQRAWLKYRETQCRFEGYTTRGGTAESLNADACRKDLTDKRTADLKSLLEAFGR